MNESLVPPEFMSGEAVERWRRVVADLLAHGLDPSSRRELISDFVDLDHRIGELRRQSQAGTGDMRMAVTRALNVATAERRRLHAALFAGGRRVEPRLAIKPEDESAAQRRREADDAWRQHFADAERIPRRPDPRHEAAIREHAQREQDVRTRFGPPSWVAFLYATAAAEIEADRIIAGCPRGMAAEPA